jgi:hypothetical protein
MIAPEFAISVLVNAVLVLAILFLIVMMTCACGLEKSFVRFWRQLTERRCMSKRGAFWFHCTHNETLYLETTQSSCARCTHDLFMRKTCCRCGAQKEKRRVW